MVDCVNKEKNSNFWEFKGNTAAQNGLILLDDKTHNVLTRQVSS